MINLYDITGFGARHVDVCIKNFPDNTAHIDVSRNLGDKMYIDWRYENEEELAYLIYLTKHIRAVDPQCSLSLRMHYIPNARMDRVEKVENVFTLKYFCDVINWLEFERVFVFDPHSNVSLALLDRVYVVDKIEEYVGRVKFEIGKTLEVDFDDIVLYYPDEGATKKYSKILKNERYCYGRKNRDWDTGAIVGLEIVNPYNIDLTGKYIIIVDDIISYGGTMYFGAEKLKQCGVSNIFAYASHVENSVLDRNKSKMLKAFEKDFIKMVYTTNSIYTGRHEKIEVI